MHSNTLSHSGK